MIMSRNKFQHTTSLSMANRYNRNVVETTCQKVNPKSSHLAQESVQCNQRPKSTQPNIPVRKHSVSWGINSHTTWFTNSILGLAVQTSALWLKKFTLHLWYSSNW